MLRTIHVCDDIAPDDCTTVFGSQLSNLLVGIPLRVPEPTGEAAPAFPTLSSQRCGNYLFHDPIRRTATSVGASRSIPAAGHVRSRCVAQKRIPFPVLNPENGRGSPPSVLHCLPLAGLRGG